MTAEDEPLRSAEAEPRSGASDERHEQHDSEAGLLLHRGFACDEQRRRHALDPARHRDGSRHTHPLPYSQARKSRAQHAPLEGSQGAPFHGTDCCE